MASGKTTFGSALAETLRIPFIDLDEFIVEKEGRSIAEIFAQNGEETFRTMERDYLREAAEAHENAVIACGGGTPCHFDNMNFLNEKGLTVFMETSIPVLISRLQAQNEVRPIMAGLSDEEISRKVLSQLCERLPKYMEAKLKWNGDDLETPQQIQANVKSFVSSYPSLFRDL